MTKKYVTKFTCDCCFLALEMEEEPSMSLQKQKNYPMGRIWMHEAGPMGDDKDLALDICQTCLSLIKDFIKKKAVNKIEPVKNAVQI